MSTPLISIGIIFKNDIRCIERCLKALQPLRDAVPSELVMADTGSTDGSREIAEKYADILIDFPWIDDFAAARNAVLDRASGQWYFSVDTDEYLDEDVSELTAFLRKSDRCSEIMAMVIVRNYNTYDMDGDYSDFTAGRIIRMSAGLRYEGAIHEHFGNNVEEIVVTVLQRTILHHDGYAIFREDKAAAAAKTERNVRMIGKALEAEPNNLILRMQMIESAGSGASIDYIKHIRESIELIREKKSGWELVGPSILRHAVYAAERDRLPEWDEWLQMAEEWFPNSMYTRLDVEYAAFAHEWNEGKNPEHALRRGERYLKALEDYRNGADPLAQTFSTLQMATPFSECMAKVHMINAYCSREQVMEAFELAKTLDYSRLDVEQTGKLISALQDIHFKSMLDTAPVISKLWDSICDTKKSKEYSNQRKKTMLATAARTFIPKNRQEERKKDTFLRYAYTLYLPLKDKCDIGRAAAVMDTDDAAEMETILAEVESWNNFSIYALSHALECGASFPLSNKVLNVEDMDSLASRLAADKESFFPLVLRIAERVDAENWQGLCWARGLLMAAVRAYPWSSKERDEEQGMAIARTFAKVEKEFVPLCYAPESLREERLFALPPLHRFGWYCAQAFDALERGNTVDYVRLLRSGLDASEGVKNMVEFLVDHTQEIQLTLTPPELKALADQVRVILARFAPDDPSVAALKQSEAYQKVAHLIEGTAALVWGGQLQ